MKLRLSRYHIDGQHFLMHHIDVSKTFVVGVNLSTLVAKVLTIANLVSGTNSPTRTLDPNLRMEWEIRKRSNRHGEGILVE